MSNTMTSEEAISYLMNFNISFSRGNGKTRLLLALKKAIEALEYRIPKKPLMLKNDEDIKIGAGTWKAGVTIYKCPRCNGFISRSNDFCPKCGQALDWSDEE